MRWAGRPFCSIHRYTESLATPRCFATSSTETQGSAVNLGSSYGGGRRALGRAGPQERKGWDANTTNEAIQSRTKVGQTRRDLTEHRRSSALRRTLGTVDSCQFVPLLGLPGASVLGGRVHHGCFLIVSRYPRNAISDLERPEGLLGAVGCPAGLVVGGLARPADDAAGRFPAPLPAAALVSWLDHPVIARLLAGFRSLSPEDFGLIVQSPDGRTGALGLWRIDWTGEMRIPRPFGHPFHGHSATDSTLIRPPVPRRSGH